MSDRNGTSPAWWGGVDYVDALSFSWRHRLAVDRDDDRAVQAALRPDADLGVGAVGQDGHVIGPVVPLVHDLDATDRQRGVDRDRFGRDAVEARRVRAV